MYISDWSFFHLFVQPTSQVQLFATPWTAAHQASLSLTVSWSLLKPGNSTVKESSCNAGDPGLVPGPGRSPGEGIGFPLQYSWAFLVAQMVKNLPALQETWVQSLGWEDPLEKGMATHSRILAWRIPMNRGESPWTAWWATVHGVTKSLTQLSDFHFSFFQVYWVCDAIQPSCPPSLSSPPALNQETRIAFQALMAGNTFYLLRMTTALLFFIWRNWRLREANW